MRPEDAFISLHRELRDSSDRIVGYKVLKPRVFDPTSTNVYFQRQPDGSLVFDLEAYPQGEVQ